MKAFNLLIRISFIFLFFFSCSCSQSGEDGRLTCRKIEKNYIVLLEKGSKNENEVIESVEAFLQKNRHCNSAYMLLGELKTISKDYRSAKQLFHIALKVDSNNVYLLFKMGLAFKEQKKYDSAVFFFNKAEAIKNVNGYVFDYNTEFSEMSGSPIKDVKYSTIIFHRGLACYESGDYSRALIDLNYCINHREELKYSYFFRALVHLRLNKSEEACADAFNTKLLGNDNVDKYFPSCPLLHSILLNK